MRDSGPLFIGGRSPTGRLVRGAIAFGISSFPGTPGEGWGEGLLSDEPSAMRGKMP
ncbi:MAG: hypothetical protein JWP03_434, partial [Phycisphaerales bacterium]|nr:hypothetical protein [Phycisphaerales bacterium]